MSQAVRSGLELAPRRVPCLDVWARSHSSVGTSSLDLREGRLNLVEVTLVALGPATFAVIEIGKERVSGVSCRNPLSDASWLGEVADVFGAEVLLRPRSEYVSGIDGFGATTVDDDVAVDLENPQPSHEWFIHRTSGCVPLQVVEVAGQGHPAIASELLSHCFFHPYHGSWR